MMSSDTLSRPDTDPDERLDDAETRRGRRRANSAAIEASPEELETFLPTEGREPAPEDLDRVAFGSSRDDALTVIGAAVAAISMGVLLSLVLGVVTIGWMPFVSFLWFVLIYTALVFLKQRGPAVTDRYWTIMLWAAGVVVIGALGLVIGYILVSGQDVWGQMFDPDSGQSLWERLHFLTQDMGGVGPLSGLEAGGILHAIVGTLIQMGIALAITLPLGLTTALFLAEVGGRFARFVRTIVEAMTALPSVVAGLFIYASVIVLFTKQSNGFAASLAITVLMLPIMIRAADVVLRLVPGNLREAGLALGASRWQVVWRVVLPTVRSGLATAVILALAHGIGETAPVLLTAGITSNMNVNPFEGPMTSLPLAALDFVRSAKETMHSRGFATAATLMVLVLILFVTARAIGGQEPGKLTPAQRARLTQRSRRTAARVGQAPAQAARELADPRSGARPARAVPSDHAPSVQEDLP